MLPAGLLEEGYYEIAKFTAEYIAEAVSSFVPSAKKPLFVLAIPSGNTALGVYQVDMLTPPMVTTHRSAFVLMSLLPAFLPA